MDTQKALQHWHKGENSRFDFAVEIADGENEPIADMADRCKRTASLFYGYRIGGKCWLDFRDFYGDEMADKYRDLLPITFWVTVGRKIEQRIFDYEDVLDWFKDALDNDWNAETFSQKIRGAVGSDEFDFKREAAHIEKRYFQFVAFGTSQKHVRKIQRAAKLLYGRLLAAGGGSQPVTSGD
jgi:hypothetical protein